jgi:hypothetical protein
VNRKIKLGKKYGKLLVVEEDYENDICKCLCDCGNVKEIKRSDLTPGKKGGPKSCGCLWAEKYGVEHINDRTQAGNKIYPKEMKSHKLYGIWKNIRRKKGVNPGSVDEWKDYKVFYNWAINKWQEGLRCYSKDFNKPHGPDNTIFVHPSVISKESQNRDEVKEKIKAINIKKYGYAVYTQDPDRKHLINSRKSSKQEKSVAKFIEKLGFATKSDRKILNGKELDILIEGLDIAIEYCGIYWHSEIHLNKNYHKEKYTKCLEQGIKLITIFSDEWRHRRPQVESMLRTNLGKNKRVYGRDCQFKPIEKTEGKKFVNDCHIQELNRASSHNFGLYYKDELVSVMLFDRHPRDNNKLTLSRFCTKYGISVVGGASKLFKNSLNYLPNKDIYTWSDNRWSNGFLYNTLGFTLIKELPIDYSYVHNRNPNKRIPKQKMKKSNINCPKDITEKAFLENLGYYRIWDCGKKSWLYKR